MNKIITIFLSVIGFFALTSCDENDGQTDEYANWNQRNNQYFESVYNTATKAIAGKDTKWKILDTWTKEPSAIGMADKIVVEVLNVGEGEASPKTTDSVRVHYRGTLMPTEEHPDGLIFDSSWTGKYNPKTMLPVKFLAGGTVDGFSLALIHMHEGDRWRIYMPQQLGYGSSGSGSIPGYSTLIFDLTLETFWSPGTVAPARK